ncbi:FMN-binding negative transcriptional regulator [Psychromonas sp. KJ10-10]|uniref:FMN-binding negative transcriptional regulator n=1 Tax=Psychromonas sp. KJ10-10 TaxID=3391823 RepID=UPI0039B426E7
MHIPKIFQQDDPLLLQEIMVKYPFASLVTHSGDGVEVNHLPLYFYKSGGNAVLQGHIAKANPLWKMLNEHLDVLVVFNGPNCYISPNFYPTKKDNGKAVPTWNYIAVHVRGEIKARFDEHFKLQMLNNLTFQQEQYQDKPWSIYDAPSEYINRLLPAIVGIEIQIKSMTGQWKVSQNQPEINKQGIISGLSKVQSDNSVEMATLVKNY